MRSDDEIRADWEGAPLAVAARLICDVEALMADRDEWRARAVAAETEVERVTRERDMVCENWRGYDRIVAEAQAVLDEYTPSPPLVPLRDRIDRVGRERDALRAAVAKVRALCAHARDELAIDLAGKVDRALDAALAGAAPEGDPPPFVYCSNGLHSIPEGADCPACLVQATPEGDPPTERTGFCVCDDGEPQPDCGIPGHRVVARSLAARAAVVPATPEQDTQR
jgi:hypothetical protein